MQHRLESAVDLNTLGPALRSFVGRSGDIRELFVALPTDSFGTPKYDTTAMVDQRLRG